jgi:hypothetical protein
VESQKNLHVDILECWLNTQHGWRLAFSSGSVDHSNMPRPISMRDGPRLSGVSKFVKASFTPDNRLGFISLSNRSRVAFVDHAARL